jgi:CBS domain-containing protein
MHRKIIPDIVSGQQICALVASNTVREAAQKMVECNTAAVVILDRNGKLEGICTERDVTRRLVSKGLQADTTTLGQIMTANPDTLAPEDTALDALELMRERNYRHLPVVDNGRVVGMVSIRDLYAAVKVELEENIRETEAFVFGDRYGVA